ncbi:hypothetical protein GPROT1_02661 [Gammaproteobacteria bacterium]|nr:hypothetical protein GPROT1_02661 [Gammaproteobacteria bacterium]
MDYTSRNHARGFANRTRKNLKYIETAFENNTADVHVVTQIINSLLGLIIFLREKGAMKSIAIKRLADLKAEGWPEWTFTYGSSKTLDDLTKELRNAVAHGNIDYSSESRNSDEVDIEVKTYIPPEYTVLKWSAKISATHLRDFCLHLSDLIEKTPE